jgi:hypothetical protein
MMRLRTVRSCTRDEQPRQSPFHVPTLPDHAITPYRREGTNWVNHSSAFYNSLRNRKNKFVSLSRLTCGRTQRVRISELAAQKNLLSSSITWISIALVEFFSLDKINENMQWEVVALLLLIAWSNGTLWMVGFILLACTSTSDMHGS